MTEKKDDDKKEVKNDEQTDETTKSSEVEETEAVEGEEGEETVRLLPFLEGCHAYDNATKVTPGTYASVSAKEARVIVGYLHEGKSHHLASNDSGRTWCEPDSFEAVVEEPTSDCRFGGAVAVHILEDLTAVAVCREGVFYSRAAGAIWKHMPHGGSGENLDGPVLVPGTTMVEHPNFGLMLLGHEEDGDGGKLWMRTSENKGESWHDFHQDLPSGMELAHPAFLSARGAFFALAPNLGGKRGDNWHYTELCANHGRLPFAATESTLAATDAGGKLGALAMDVPALAWNEERQRIEAVVCCRGGDAERDPEGTAMSMHLWSTSPHDWLAGTPQWQHDACLAAVGEAATGPESGFAPSLAVGAGARHLIFHVGTVEGPMLCHMTLPSNFGV